MLFELKNQEKIKTIFLIPQKIKVAKLKIFLSQKKVDLNCFFKNKIKKCDYQ
jgi:hypothetical protein